MGFNIIDAIRNNDICALSSQSMDVNAKTTEGESLLYVAVKYRCEPAVKWLLDQGADIAGKNAKDWTALHLAAASGCESMVRLLIQNKAPISPRDAVGATPLMCAASKGYKEVVQLLLKSKPDLLREREQALSIAIQQDHLDIIHLLIAHKVHLATKMPLKNRIGMIYSFLEIAIIQGNTAVIECLLKTEKFNVNEVNGEGFTPIFYAERPEVLNLLLQYKADIHVSTPEGITPLSYRVFQIFPVIQDQLAAMGDHHPPAWKVLEQSVLTLQEFLRKGANIRDVKLSITPEEFYEFLGRVDELYIVAAGEELEYLEGLVPSDVSLLDATDNSVSADLLRYLKAFKKLNSTDMFVELQGLLFLQEAKVLSDITPLFHNLFIHYLLVGARIEKDVVSNKESLKSLIRNIRYDDLGASDATPEERAERLAQVDAAIENHPVVRAWDNIEYTVLSVLEPAAIRIERRQIPDVLQFVFSVFKRPYHHTSIHSEMKHGMKWLQKELYEKKMPIDCSALIIFELWDQEVAPFARHSNLPLELLKELYIAVHNMPFAEFCKQAFDHHWIEAPWKPESSMTRSMSSP